LSSINVVQRYGDGYVVIFENGERVLCHPLPNGDYLPSRRIVPPDPDPDPDPNPDPDPGGESTFKWPMNPSALNTRNGRPQDGYMTAQRPTHNGTDMSFPPAFTAGMPIRSIAKGIVNKAYWEPGGGGWAVEVKHSSRWYSGYYHAVPGSLRVSPGQSVEQGQHLMDAGESGTATGPHLHFMVVDMSKTGNYWTSHVDPEAFMAQYNPEDLYV